MQQRESNKREWTTVDLAWIRKNAHLGAEAVAEHFEVSVTAIRATAHRYGISLRKAGSRAGLRLGQPRGVKLVELGEQIAADVRAGTFDLAGAVTLIRADLADPPPLCPRCVRFPVRVKSTGLCERCHNLELAERHREKQAAAEAQRELDAAKKAASRAKSCSIDGCGEPATGSWGLCWSHYRQEKKRRETSS